MSALDSVADGSRAASRVDETKTDTQARDHVPLVLVPVEVFGGCDHPATEGHNPGSCDLWGYGLSDAVQAWSDCNRAVGRIYRVDDLDSPREPSESITVWIPREALPWFEKRWGDADDNAQHDRPGRQETR